MAKVKLIKMKAINPFHYKNQPKPRVIATFSDGSHRTWKPNEKDYQEARREALRWQS